MSAYVAGLAAVVEADQAREAEGSGALMPPHVRA